MGCNASVGINDDCAGEINTNDRMRMLKDDGHIIPSSINLVTLFMGLVQGSRDRTGRALLCLEVGHHQL